MVELEDIHVIVIPVVNPVTKIDALVGVTDAPHVDGNVVARHGHVGKEVFLRGKLLLDVIAFGVLAVRDFHVEVATVLIGVVNAEAQQHLVAHFPEQLLVFLTLHAGGSQHLFYWRNIIKITVNGTVADFVPVQLLVQFRQVAEVGDVIDVLCII